MRGFLPLSCDGTAPRLALRGQLVKQKNEHTNPCLIKQSNMLTFTQLELPRVSAVTTSGGSSGKADTEIMGRWFHQLLLLQLFLSMERRERERREGVKRG